MMGGLDTPTSGTVIVRGEELAKKNDEQAYHLSPPQHRLYLPEL